MSLIAGYSSSSEDEEGFHHGRVAINQLVVGNSDQEIPADALNDNENEFASAMGIQIKRKYIDHAIIETQASRGVKRPQEVAAISKSLKAKRKKNEDSEDLEYKGPWASYSSESDTYVEIEDSAGITKTVPDSTISAESEASDDELSARPLTEFYATEFYPTPQSYMKSPSDVDANLRKEPGARRFSVARKVTHTFTGHFKGVNKLEFFPQSGHLLLSCGNDIEIKLWDVYHKMGLLRKYSAHKHAVKDLTFNSSGTEFLSCSYDKSILLWDTETGEIKKEIKVRSTPNVVRFNPNNENQFLVGLANHSIEHYDLSIPDYTSPIQVYNHHLGPVNEITIVDDKRRFLSTSDDKSIRIWDWNVNIPIKAISDPSQNSMPKAKLHPAGEFVALQCMDNSIHILQAHGKFKFNKRKFKGHNVAGYGIDLDISSDGRILMSGDSRGFIYFWDWKTSKLNSKIKLSDKAVTCIRKHPQEAGKVVASGFDGIIYYCN